MNRVIPALALSLLLISASVPRVSVAEGDGPSASGDFQIVTETGRVQDIKFNAKLGSDGSTAGEIIFRDGVKASPSKALQNANPESSQPDLYAKAVCNCLVVKGIEAVMVGTVTEANLEQYIGRRVLIAVQDGDSITPPLRDKLTFGFYKSTPKGWLTSDSERSSDEPAPPSNWVASDLERPDQPGLMAQKGEEITCDSFPLNSHSFIPAKGGKGTIRVTR